MYVDTSIIVDAIEKVIAHYDECLLDDSETSAKADKEDYNILKLKMQSTMSSDSESAYDFWHSMDTFPRDALIDLTDLTVEEIAHCCVYFHVLPAPFDLEQERGQAVLKYIKDNKLVKDGSDQLAYDSITELDNGTYTYIR